MASPTHPLKEKKKLNITLNYKMRPGKWEDYQQQWSADNIFSFCVTSVFANSSSYKVPVNHMEFWSVSKPEVCLDQNYFLLFELYLS